MSSKKKVKETKISKFLKAPLRLLIKARDMYIQSITECATAGHVGYSSVVLGCPTGQINIVPRSYSVSSSCSSRDEDFRELVGAASTKKLELLDHNHIKRSRGATTTTTATIIGGEKGGTGMVMPRSFSTGMGKIDEDKPCEFGDDALPFPRSRSYAVSRRTWFV